jgi:hypothetical protein
VTRPFFQGRAVYGGLGANARSFRTRPFADIVQGGGLRGGDRPLSTTPAADILQSGTQHDGDRRQCWFDSPRCRLTLPLRGFFVAASVPSVRVPDVTDERRQKAALAEDPPIGR